MWPREECHHAASSSMSNGVNPAGAPNVHPDVKQPGDELVGVGNAHGLLPRQFLRPAFTLLAPLRATATRGRRAGPDHRTAGHRSQGSHHPVRRRSCRAQAPAGSPSGARRSADLVTSSRRTARRMPAQRSRPLPWLRANACWRTCRQQPRSPH